MMPHLLPLTHSPTRTRTRTRTRTHHYVHLCLHAEMDFAYVTDHSLLEECSGTDCTSPLVVMYKRDEAEQPRYTGEFSPALLKAWAAAKSLPLVIKFGSSPTPATTKALQKVFSGSLPRLIAVAKKVGGWVWLGLEGAGLKRA